MLLSRRWGTRLIATIWNRKVSGRWRCVWSCSRRPGVEVVAGVGCGGEDRGVGGVLGGFVEVDDAVELTGVATTRCGEARKNSRCNSSRSHKVIPCFRRHLSCLGRCFKDTESSVPIVLDRLQPLKKFLASHDHVAQRVDEELTSRLMALNLRAATNNPSGASRPRVTFTELKAADLPQKPFFPKREVFGAGGLFAGLLGGLVVAAIAGWRRRLTVSAG